MGRRASCSTFVRHLNNEITEQRVDAVLDAFHELMVQNVQLDVTQGGVREWKPEARETQVRG